MKINWKILDQMLIGEMDTDDITLKCKEEIQEFLYTHKMDVLSEESLKELAGIFKLSIRPAYEAQTGEKIPNIFHRIDLEEEEDEVLPNG